MRWRRHARFGVIQKYRAARSGDSHRTPDGSWIVLAFLVAGVLGAPPHREARADRIKFRNPGFRDTLYPIQVNNWWGHMNQNGDLIVRPRFDWSDYSYEGLSRVVIDGKTGFIKGNGGWRIDPNFVYADRFSEGLAVVGQGNLKNMKYGFLDKRGRLRVPIRLEGALRFKDGLAAVQVGERCGFINKSGRVAIAPQFHRVRSFHDGLAMVQHLGSKDRPGPLGYIDKRGRSVFRDDAQHLTDLGDFNETLARVKVSDRWGYIHRNFRIRIKPQFEDARDFTGGLAAVKLNGKWGYIDKKGTWIVPPRFDMADDLDERLAMVQLNGRFGYVNRAGRWGIDPKFVFAEPFFRRFAMVITKEGMGYIDSSSRFIWDPGQAKQGFVDKTFRESVGIGTAPGPDSHIHHRVRMAPDGRPPALSPYPPEYLYEEVLPP